ncbi:hypothetical protein Tco_1141537 [Tanacetum coccineum]
MDNTRAYQKALDDESVAPADRLMIGKINLRLSSILKSKEPTLQVALDALKLTPFYNAFEISADVPEIYMQEFWVTVSRHHSSLRFKLNGKSHTVNVDNFRDMLKICPKLPGQIFEEPPLEEEILSFIRDLGHTGEIKFLSDVNVNHMHQPWRSFAAIINKCLSGKTTALESLRLSRAQILWGMYHNKTVDYVYLMWEDLVYQVENKNSKKNNDMYYPRFTKVIVDYFMAKDQGIPRRNKMFWHYARDDFMFTTVRVISKHQDTQVYGAILPQHLTNQAMLESEAYMTYRAYATGEKTPKPKTTKKKADSESSPKTKSTQASKGKRITTLAKGDKPAKKKQSVTKSKGDGVDIQSKVPDEQQQNISGTNEGAGDKPEVPDVPEYRSESEEESWTYSKGEDDEDNDEHHSENDNDDEDDDQENANDQEEEKEEEKANDDDDVSYDQMVSTPPDYEIMKEEENQEDDDNTEEVHMTLTTEPPEVEQQSSSVSSDFVSKFINPSPNTKIPNFASLFGFERRVSSLETELSDLKQTNQFDEALSSIPGIVDNYLVSKIKDAVNVAVHLQSNKLREEAQADNDEFLKQIDSNIKAIIKDQVKAHTSYAAAASLLEFELKKILIDKIEENKSMNRSDIQKNIYNTLIESYNSDKDLFASYGDVVTLKRERDDQDKDEEPSTGSNRETKQRRSDKEESQPKSSGKSAQAEDHGPRVDELEEPLHQEFNTGNDDVSPLAQASGTQSSFNEFLATPIDFSAFIMNRLKLNNLTQDVLTGLTYDLMKVTCKSVVELEYHLEEVFKATNDQLDWHNPEGRPYPHDLSKPLPLIQNAQGRQVIPFDHFINNDLGYLKGGSLSKKYTTSLTKTKDADYGHVKWIEDKVPRNVYSRHRIIIVTSLKIIEFFSYKHLEEITVQRQDDQLYRFREGDFKRLHRQDIKDMLLLLVQGKLTNLNLDERFALNVALRMYTRRIVIQKHVEDLQLAVESYQKKINLSRPDSYRLDLRKMTPYTAYHDIQGIFYQDDMDINRLMRTDELHKFSDGTLNHVRTAFNDIATRIQMEYLPKKK